MSDRTDPTTTENMHPSLAVLEMTSRAMSDERKWEPTLFYRTACRQAAETAGSHGASLFLADSAGHSIILISSFDDADIQIPGRRFQRGEGVAGAAFASGQMEVHQSSSPHASFRPSRSAPVISAVAALPLVNEAGRILGVLCVHNPRIADDEFVPGVLENLRSYGRALAAGLSIIRMAETLYESSTRYRVDAERWFHLYSSASVLLSGASSTIVSEEILRSLMRFIDVERAGIYRPETEVLRPLAVVGLPERLGKPLAFGAPRSGARDMVESLLVEAAVEMREKSLAPPKEIGRAPGRQALGPVLALPVVIEERLVAVFLTARGLEDLRPFTDEEIASCRAILAQTALLIEHALKRDDGDARGAEERA